MTSFRSNVSNIIQHLPAQVGFASLGPAVSMLIDTEAAATLLRLDVWEQIVAHNQLPLEPCPSLRLLGAGGQPLTVHGHCKITLGLGSNTFVVDAVVVNPLTSQAILGLNFLVEQRATIDLPNRTLRLGERWCNIPLEDPPRQVASLLNYQSAPPLPWMSHPGVLC